MAHLGSLLVLSLAGSVFAGHLNMVARQTTSVSCSTVVAVPQPTGATCNMQGLLNKPVDEGFVLQRFQISSGDPDPFTECRNKCLDLDACLSFGFNENSLFCRLFNNTLSSQGFKYPHRRKGIPKNDRACFTTSCPPAYCAEPATSTPTISLVSSTPIVEAGRSASFDDTSYTVTLPFPAQIYGVSNDVVVVDNNGFIALSNDTENEGEYSNLPLPQDYYSGASGLPSTSLAAFWDDLYLFAGTSQGIFYEVQGQAPNRTAYFEYITSHYQDDTQSYHFIVGIPEGDSEAITYTYYDVSDFGISATVGAQDSTAMMFTQYSYDNQSIAPNLQLTYNSATNKFEVTNEGCKVAYTNPGASRFHAEIDPYPSGPKGKKSP